MSTVRISGVKKHSSVNGPGVRYVLFFQGCPHNCPGCQNPETHDPMGGTERDTADVIREILQTKYLDGLTFSGGDPMYQPEGFAELARAIHERTRKDIWCYTGFTFEALLHMPRQRQLLNLIDVLVDGPFLKAQRDESLIFRGSRNQRIIDVQASIAQGRTVMLSYTAAL